MCNLCAIRPNFLTKVYECCFAGLL
jgi:hypothetical protein